MLELELLDCYSIDFLLAPDRWRSDPTCVMYWYIVEVGMRGESVGHDFQTCVATRKAIAERQDRGPFHGFVVNPFHPDRVEPAITAYLDTRRAYTWESIESQLEPRLIAHYEKWPR